MPISSLILPSSHPAHASVDVCPAPYKDVRQKIRLTRCDATLTSTHKQTDRHTERESTSNSLHDSKQAQGGKNLDFLPTCPCRPQSASRQQTYVRMAGRTYGGPSVTQSVLPASKDLPSSKDGHVHPCRSAALHVHGAIHPTQGMHGTHERTAEMRPINSSIHPR